jgi:uncharacterized membrane protein YuzA (DUF378 family)
MEYVDKILYKLAMMLLVVGALNWFLVGAAKVNAVSILFGNSWISRVIYVLVGLAAIYVMFRRDFYLPFLGEGVLPCSAFSDRIPPGATRVVKLSIAPGTKVLYWSAEPKMEELKEIRDWKAAYGRFENAGVATAGDDGIAYLKVREPSPYQVPFFGGLMKKQLEPHIHYRICGGNGLLSRVETVYLTVQGHIEGFESAGPDAAPISRDGKKMAADTDEIMRIMTELMKVAESTGAAGI